jgi:putative intracellular protease/amidase
MTKILAILTSHSELGSSGERTGFWFEELAAPYYEFIGQGAHVTVASPRGGLPPIDPRSEAEPSDVVRRFQADEQAMAKLRSTVALADVDEQYDAYFVAGGHGVMWDLSVDATLAKLLSRAADAGKVIGAVCHGPAALVGVERDGQPLVKGKRVTGFTDEEERAVKLADSVPFLLETRLRELGARFESGPMWSSFAVRDGRLVTGQNPQSSAATARELLAALGGDPSAPKQR